MLDDAAQTNGGSVHGNVVMACQDNLAFMAGLKSESIHLVVTSPPIISANHTSPGRRWIRTSSLKQE